MAFVGVNVALRQSLTSTEALQRRTCKVVKGRNHFGKTYRGTSVTRRWMMASEEATPLGTSATSLEPVKLEQFFDDAKSLGTIRFISISRGGSVLETIGRFDYPMKTFDIPTKGTYLTLSSDDKTFECHLPLQAVARVTLSVEKAKIGGHDLYVIRFFTCDDIIILSCMLQFDPSRGPSHYLFGAVDAFLQLRTRYGDQFVVAH